MHLKTVNEFYKNRRKYQVKVDKKGVTLVDDPETNTFASYNKDGITKIYFNPIVNNLTLTTNQENSERIDKYAL